VYFDAYMQTELSKIVQNSEAKFYCSKKAGIHKKGLRFCAGLKLLSPAVDNKVLRLWKRHLQHITANQDNCTSTINATGRKITVCSFTRLFAKLLRAGAVCRELTTGISRTSLAHQYMHFEWTSVLSAYGPRRQRRVLFGLRV